MNQLNLIRRAILKRQAVNDAQHLMAKAYRGVSYVDAHHGAIYECDCRKLNYRGTSYMSMK